MRLTAGLAMVVITAVSLFAIACGGGGGEEANGSTPTPGFTVVVVPNTTSATPRARKTPTPSASPSPTPLQVCAPNPDPADKKVLQVEEPLPNSQARIPVHIRGWGSNIGLNNAGVYVGVVNAKQDVVQVIQLSPLPREYRVAPPGLEVTDNTRPFAADIVLNDVSEPTPYCLWVYLSTNENGRAQQVVQVPVVMLPRQ